MQYRKPSFPDPLWRKFNKVAKKLKYKKPGEKWLLLDALLTDALRFDKDYLHGFVIKHRP